jgi:hypothetical protein
MPLVHPNLEMSDQEQSVTRFILHRRNITESAHPTCPILVPFSELFTNMLEILLMFKMTLSKKKL